MPVARLSDLLGRAPSNNRGFIKNGRLTHSAEGAIKLQAGGCAAVLCPDGKYHCPMCGGSWVPQPDVMPPCDFTRESYEQGMS